VRAASAPPCSSTCHYLSVLTALQVADVLSLGAVMKMLWGEVPREPGQEELHEAMMHWHFVSRGGQDLPRKSQHP
jgi:hypothetical protein